MKTILIFHFMCGQGGFYLLSFCLEKEIVVQKGDHFADLCLNEAGSEPDTWNIENELDYFKDLDPVGPQDPYQVVADQVTVYYNRGNPVRIIQAVVDLDGANSEAHGDGVTYHETVLRQVMHLASQFNVCAYISFPEKVEVPDFFKPENGWCECKNPGFNAYQNS